MLLEPLYEKRQLDRLNDRTPTALFINWAGRRNTYNATVETITPRAVVHLRSLCVGLPQPKRLSSLETKRWRLLLFSCEN